MKENRYWDKNGHCRACQQPLNMHAPKDFRSLETGAKCFFGMDGKLRADIMVWLRPIILAGIEEFQKRNGDDSLIERTELANAILQHRGEVAEIEANHSREIAKLHDKLVEFQESWRAYHENTIGKVERHLSASNAEVQSLKTELRTQCDAHQEEIAQLCSKHDDALTALDKVHQKELSRVIAQIDALKQKRVIAKPPPSPKKSVSRYRTITPSDLENLAPKEDCAPLPGLPKPLLKVV